MILSKAEAKTWTAAASGDWQTNNREDSECTSSVSSYLWAAEWAIHMTPSHGYIFIQFIFHMVKPKLKIKWKLVKQRAWAVTLN